ncbi:VUT family protein [Acuticoccus sp. MNP-M23]|uniref:VUT family protein n=1 Tax=Acuticoccus sp. MNP-M23 TaxID=3072793 RepID=UPI0028165DE5|nr:VUT family protein [Acuticoccus sp. MNP-M23]WMS43637.1 VUT family protein [Acuticoccus sp. MNP-M23]
MTATPRAALIAAVAAMAAVVVASNILVLHPVQGTFGGINLADMLTYGAFTYPFAFLVTDVVNRTFGPAMARRVALCGFAIAVVMSLYLATPRIALASGSAFLLAQMFDVSMFNRLRHGRWWRAPLISSFAASLLDTVIFFTLAFSVILPFGLDAFATESAPLLGLAGAPDVPRWISWALADFTVKLTVAAFALGPYRALTARTSRA